MCKSFIKGIALLLVILFFVPTTVVSCENEFGSFFSMKLSAYGLATGNIKIDTNFNDSEFEETYKEAKEEYTGNFILFGLLILPILIFIYSTDHLFRTFFCDLINMILMISMNKNYIPTKLEPTGYLPYLTLERTAAYSIYIILSIIILLLSAYQIYNILTKNLYKLIVSYENSSDFKCECGTILKNDDIYCPVCGKQRIEIDKQNSNTNNTTAELSITSEEKTETDINSNTDNIT